MKKVNKRMEIWERALEKRFAEIEELDIAHHVVLLT